MEHRNREIGGTTGQPAVDRQGRQMEPTITYVMEVCGDGLGIMSGPDGTHTVVRVGPTDAGLSVEPLVQVASLTDAWEVLFTYRMAGPPSTPRLPE